jgi:hypothetical protein
MGYSRPARTAFRSLLNLFPLVLLLLSIPTTAQAQQPATQPDPPWVEKEGPPLPPPPPLVSFSFERPGLPVPRYSLHIFEGGAGVYRGEEMPMVVGHSDVQPSPQPFALKNFSVSPATAAKVFALARSLNHFNIACASKAKNIADTGEKTLSYADTIGVSGSCDYNYSENKDVQTLTDIFQGIAETIDEGRKLDYLHRFDRLGLDAEMESFTREVSDGHAIELQAIADTLRSIAADPDVMQRVRTRANALLTLVPAQTRQAAQ